MRRFSFILILAVVCAGRLLAADTGAEFDAANKLYNQGKFAAAADGYEKIIRSGAVSPAVHFNLGNACFKAGQFGRAIAAYRRAQQSTPRDADVRANLQFARKQIGDNLSVTPGLAQRALGKLTLNEWTAFAAVALWGWFVLLALGQWRSAWRSALQSYVLFAGLATAALGGCVAADWAVNYSVKSAIVIADEAVVRQGPLDEAQATFTAKDGAELTVLDEKDGWLQVNGSQRRSGWVKRAAVQVL